MSNIYGYINFSGKCREAMNFYKDCIGGELVLQEIGGSPMEQYMPNEPKQNILHSTLTKGDLLLMASDLAGPGDHAGGGAVSLMLNADSEQELQTVFEKLSAGGQHHMKPEHTFWNAVFCSFTDKFGIKWSINYDKTPHRK